MPLPDFPQITDDLLRSIVSRHQLQATSFYRMPQVGIFNAIYSVGDNLILRVPRDHPKFVTAARNEAVAVPLARAAGISTPELVVFDETLDILPVPYSIYERVPGATLENSTSDPAEAGGAWRALGGDLALLHEGVAFRYPATLLIAQEQKTDPRPLPVAIARAGYFGAAEARWLNDWLERLAPFAQHEGSPHFLHGDTQATNVMVDPESLTYRAVIDWGSCRWGDVAHDFAGVSLRAVPAMLEGYREITGWGDETIEARILWRHLQIGLHQLRGEPQPQQSWAERPTGMLLDILRFFIEQPDRRWTQWSPTLPR